MSFFSFNKFEESYYYYFAGEEQWLGLDAIYKLTNRYNIKMQLKIFFERFSGETASVLYDDFSLEDQVKHRHKQLSIVFLCII